MSHESLEGNFILAECRTGSGEISKECSRGLKRGKGFSERNYVGLRDRLKGVGGGGSRRVTG